MDAGIAAVLGAMAGATGSVITGIIARSQAKMQIRADHSRMAYEQRHAACRQFLECVEKTHALISDVHANVRYRFDHTAPIPGDSDALMEIAMDRAKSAMGQAISESQPLGSLYAAVALLGPELQTAAAAARNATTEDIEHAQRWLVAEDECWDDCDDYEEPAETVHARSGICNSEFARAASAVLRNST